MLMSMPAITAIRAASFSVAATCQTVTSSKRGETATKTILIESEQQLPLRIVRAFKLDDGSALVHLHNLSGGVLGGDQLDLTVEVGPRALAQVSSTGATRIYRSRRNAAPAQQRLQISVEDNGLTRVSP